MTATEARRRACSQTWATAFVLALSLACLAAVARGGAPKTAMDPIKLGFTLDLDEGSFTLGFDMQDGKHGDPAIFSSLPVSTTVDGQTLTAGVDLKLKDVKTCNGTDKLGHFRETRFIWQRKGNVDDTWTFETAVLRYEESETLVFVQNWPQGANDTSVHSSNHAASHWPSLAIAPSYYDKVRHDRPLEYVDYLTQLNIGLLSFNDRFMQRSAADVLGYATHEFGGERAGPMIFFDRHMSWNLAIGPLAGSMATTVQGLDIREGEIFASGLLGSIDHVPPGFELRTIFTISGAGVTVACKQLGEAMLAYHDIGDMRQEAIARDISLSYLGYITDNGAYYYYKTENGATYEDTMLQVYEDAKSKDIPYRYIQLDSWWYKRGKGGGVERWEARDDVFPHGLAEFSKRTDWPLFLHNRYWSPDNVYNVDNGGKYHFEVENSYSVPLEQEFWDDLMRNMSAKGMFVYEQDWLYNEFEGMPSHLMREPTLGTSWLAQMARAALAYNVSIQYCMPLPRMVLQSIEHPAVTQVRAGDDYHPGNTQNCRFPYCLYYIQTTSLLLWSLDLAPAKDVFWTSQVQPGNPYGEAEEPHAEMLAAVAVYSAGPVQVGDKVGHADKRVIDLMCAPDGRLLQPSRPLTAIDQCFIDAAFGGAQPNVNIGTTLSTKGHEICAISSTHTYVDGHKWVHVVSILSQMETVVTPAMLPVDADPSQKYLAYTGYGAPRNFTQLGDFDSTHPMRVPRSGASDFRVFHAAPWLGDNDKGTQIAILGEAAKLVPVSEHRFAAIKWESGGVRLGLRGVPGESVVVTIARRNLSRATASQVPPPVLDHIEVKFAEDYHSLLVPLMVDSFAQAIL